MEQLYLIGKNIAHSVSPAMYNALFAELGLDWRYELADCESEAQAQTILGSDAWLSINITTPYKPLVLDVAQVKAASVQLSGGANMLFRKEGQILALNTDGIGCVRAIQHQGYSFADARVVVCGTGPTALAIVAAVAQAGAGRITLIGRDRARTQRVLESFIARYKKLAYATLDLEPARAGERSFREAYEQPHYLFGTYETSTQEIAGADILIDATPLGMQPGDTLPFPAHLLSKQHLVFDVVYGHGESPVLSAADAVGLATMNGQGMVVAQAVENASLLLAANEVENALSWEAMFKLMYAAAFAC